MTAQRLHAALPLRPLAWWAPVAWLAIVVAVAAGCGAEGAPEPSGLGTQLGKTTAWVPQPSWQHAGDMALDANGLSAPVQVPIAVAARYLAVRARPLPATGADPLCLRFVEVQRSDGQVWVGPGETQAGQGACVSCARPVSTQHGYALAVFGDPSVGQPVPTTLSLRVQLRHCASDLPVPRGALGSVAMAVRIETASEPGVDPGKPMTLDAILAVGPGAWLGDRAALAKGLATRLAAQFAVAGIDLRLRLVVDLEAAAAGLPATLDVSSRDLAETAQLQLLVDEAWQASVNTSNKLSDMRAVVVVLWPCLILHDPLTDSGTPLVGFATRMPGGSRVGTSASLVLAATGACQGQPQNSDLDRLGATVAHELGHALGLYHSDGPHGLPSSVTATDLMHSQFASLGADHSRFSPAQCLALREHPDVVPR